MNMSDLEQGSRDFRRKSWKIDLLSPIPSIVLTLGYLVLLFDLASLESVTLASCLMGSAIGVGVVAESGRRRQSMPITRYLEENASGVDAGSAGADASLAFRAVVALPLQRQRVKFLGGLAPIIIVPPLMWAFKGEYWQWQR